MIVQQNITNRATPWSAITKPSAKVESKQTTFQHVRLLHLLLRFHPFRFLRGNRLIFSVGSMPARRANRGREPRLFPHATHPPQPPRGWWLG